MNDNWEKFTDYAKDVRYILSVGNISVDRAEQLINDKFCEIYPMEI